MRILRAFVDRLDDPALPALRYVLTQPGDRRKAIAFWDHCARVWIARRFGVEEGWKPASRLAIVARRRTEAE